MSSRKLWLTLVMMAMASAASTQPTISRQAGPMMGQGMMGGGMMMGSMVRHHQAMMYGIPEPYRSVRNPLTHSDATLRRGAQVYAENCAACHGPKGYGDGPAGKRLSPRPADLAWLSRSQMVGDRYVYWTVAEGGQPVGSAMPAFKASLSQRDIWAVVTYVRQDLGARPR